MVLVCGIEESGRGPVIGPMVICGAMINENNLDKLEKLNVRDSKVMTPKAREKMYQDLQNYVKYEVIIIPPSEIDDALEADSLNLNKLEGNKMAEVINTLDPDKVIIDCPSNNIKEFVRFVKKSIKKEKEIIAEHKADANYRIVSAASVIAKVTRDREIEVLKKEIGINFGSGYATDPRTVDFLQKNWDQYPHIFRKTWESYKRIIRMQGQKNLDEF